MIHTGGCLCGSVRYESQGDAVDSAYCHCKTCQLLSGSTVLPFASFLTETFAYVKSEPAIYRSSSFGQREFCASCGSQIAFRDNDHPETIEINVGTLDDPDRAAPRYHIWYDSRVSWFETADDLPRHPTSLPEPGD